MMKIDLLAILVNRKTVEQAYAVRFRQVRLGTAARSVSGIPGTAAAAIAVRKTDLGIEPAIGGIEVAVGSARSWALVASPVVAGVILDIGESRAIGLTTGEHFVPTRKASGLYVIPVVVAWIGIVVQARHDLAFFRQSGELIQTISLMCQFHRVAVQVRKILRDHLALEVVPRACADAVAGVRGRLAGPRLRAQVSMPGAISGAGGSGECLAMCVSAGQSAEIAAVANGFTRHEKTHHRRGLHSSRIFARPLDLSEQQAAGEHHRARNHQG